MADCPTIAEFRSRFPEFSEIANPEIQRYLDDSCDYLNDAEFGDCWPKAPLYYAAHLVSLAVRAQNTAVTQPAASGAVSSSSAGGLSISFASVAPKNTVEAWYQSTIYGQTFWVLATECVDIARLVEC